MWIALLLLSVLLLWLLQALLFRKTWNKGLDVIVSFKDTCVFEGEHSAIKETIRNDKLLPIASLAVRLSMDRSLQFLKGATENSGVSDHTYKKDIFSFLFRQQITRTLPFAATKRGLYQIESVDVTAYDFFFQKGPYQEYSQNSQIYVFPKPVDIRRIQLLSQAISGAVMSQSRLFPDPFEFSGIREYRKEDPMHTINWKASARNGQLMVNQHDATTDYSVTILLDLEEPYIKRNEHLVEESVRIAASLTAYLVQKRMPVRLISNALGTKGTSLDEFLPPNAARMNELYQELACISPERFEESMSTFLPKKELTNQSGETIVVISKNHSDSFVEQLHKLSESRNQLLWVMPVTAHQMDEWYKDSRLKITHWEVARQ